MVPILNLILILLIKSTYELVMKIKVPNPSNYLYPLIFDYEGQTILLTSQGNYIVTNSSGNYSLVSAEHIFDSRFHVDIAIDKVYRLHDSDNKVFYFFPNIKGKAYVKYLDKEVMEIEVNPNSHRVISGIYGTNLGFITTVHYYSEEDLSFWNPSIFTMNLKSGKVLTTNSFTETGTKQSVLSCKYIDIYSGIYCITNFGFGAIGYRKYIFDESFYYFTSFTQILVVNSNVGGIKFENIGDNFFAFVWIDSETPVIPTLLFMSKDAPQGGYSMYSSLICADADSLQVFSLYETYLILACCFNGVTSECEIFDENIIPSDITSFRTFEMSQLRINLYHEKDVSMLSFVGADLIDPSIIYHIVVPSLTCRDVDYLIKDGNEIIIDVEDLLYPNPLDWNEDSGFYFYYTRSSNGYFYELDENNQILGEIEYANENRFYKKFKYVPHNIGRTSISYRGFIKVFGSFYLPTKICNLGFEGKCYDSCEQCVNAGTDEDHQCITCNPGYYRLVGTNNCYKTNPPSYYFNITTFDFQKCADHCELCNTYTECSMCANDYELLYTFTGNEKDKFCVKNCVAQKYKWYISEQNGKRELVCLDNEKQDCPISHMYFNNETNECMTENDGNAQHSIPKESNNKTLIFDYLTEDIVGYYSNSFIDIQSNQTISVYDTSQTPADKFGLKNLTTIELGECEAKLKAAYQIPLNEKLIIAQIDEKESKNPINSLSMLIFREKGDLLDCSLCKNTTINLKLHTTTKPSSLVSNKQLTMYQTENINVFDSKDTFFNDRCSKYSIRKNGISKDVPLNIRREIFYSNFSFCDESYCKLQFTDDDNDEVICVCSIGNDNSTSDCLMSYTNGKTEKETFWKSITFINTDILFCPQLLFEVDILLNNIGFFIMSVLIFIQIINYIIYICLKEEIFGKFSANDSHRQKGVPKWNPPINDGSPEENENTNKNVTPHEKSYDLRVIQFSPQLGPNHVKAASNNLMYPTEKSEYNKTNHNSTLNSEKYNENKLLDTIPLNQAITYDKRSFCDLYIFRLKRSHLLYLMIQEKKEYYFRNITISLFLFQVSSNCFLNALFYTDYYISRNYNLGYNVFYEIPKSCYTMLIGLVLNVICGVFGKKELKFEKKSKSNSTLQKADNSINRKIVGRTRLFHVVYFIIIFILSVFYWYYVSLFCAVYQYSQINWLIGGAISVGLSMIVPFILCLISVYFRRKAIKIRNKRMFHFAKVVEAMH